MGLSTELIFSISSNTCHPVRDGERTRVTDTSSQLGSNYIGNFCVFFLLDNERVITEQKELVKRQNSVKNTSF